MNNYEILASKLLEPVRNYLAVTWTDEELDKRIGETIASGIRYLEYLASDNELTFEIGTRERQLLLDYCLYGHNNQIGEFSIIYERDLNTFQIEQEGKIDASSTV